MRTYPPIVYASARRGVTVTVVTVSVMVATASMFSRKVEAVAAVPEKVNTWAASSPAVAASAGPAEGIEKMPRVRARFWIPSSPTSRVEGRDYGWVDSGPRGFTWVR